MANTPNLNLSLPTNADTVGVDTWNLNWNTVDTWAGTFKDKIVKQGSTGIWRWQQFESGLMVCYGKTAAANYSITTAFGSCYYTSVASMATFPAGFIEKPSCQVSANMGTGLIWASIWDAQTTSAKVGVSIMSASNITANISFSLMAWGRWK